MQIKFKKGENKCYAIAEDSLRWIQTHNSIIPQIVHLYTQTEVGVMGTSARIRAGQRSKRFHPLQ